MQQPLVLMTAHGTLVCGDTAGGLCHVALEALGAGGTPLMFDLHDVARAGRHERMLTRTDEPLVLANLPGLPLGCEMLFDPGRRTVSLRQGERFFCAEPMNRVLAHDRASAGVWERFMFLTQEDFAAIRHIFGHSWIQATTKRVLRPEWFRFTEGFVLSLNGLEIDLRYNLPVMPHAQGPGGDAAAAFSFNILVDGWKIERLHLYRPLIYFTAFSSPYVLDQAFTAIGSLLEFGGYNGHIHLITDQPKELFLHNVPDLDANRLSVQPMASKDWVGFVAAKYAILDYSDAAQFQPLLFLDTDVVCDAPIDPLLATVVTLDRMSAPLEDMTSLQNNPSAGATLIQRSGLDARFGCGLNGGTVGIPNLQSFGELLELTRTIITNHNELFGRDQFRWVDQEVLNYVSFRVGHFDTASLLRFIRYGWRNDEYDGTRRLGLVHFWPGIEGRPKEDRMRDYVATLRGRNPV